MDSTYNLIFYGLIIDYFGESVLQLNDNKCVYV